MDLYIGQFLIQIREYKVDSLSVREFKEEMHYVEFILFQAENPEAALKWALTYMKNSSDVDHDGKYDLRETECVGVYDLDNTQFAVTDIAKEVVSNYGFSIDNICIDNIDIDFFSGTPNKNRLKLFQNDSKT